MRLSRKNVRGCKKIAADVCSEKDFFTILPPIHFMRRMLLFTEHVAHQQKTRLTTNYISTNSTNYEEILLSFVGRNVERTVDAGRRLHDYA